MRLYTLLSLVLVSVTLAQQFSSEQSGHNFLSELKPTLSHGAKVLTDNKSPEFQTRLERWTDTGKKTPGAIVVVANEADMIKTVGLLLKYKIPFVPAAGGHSPFSTIGKDGVIVDTTDFAVIKVNEHAQTFTITPGILIGQVIKELDAKGLIASLAASNSIGAFSSIINGGLSTLSHLIGVPSDNIISARMITGTGKVITVSSKENSDLFYGIRGAGTYLGFVLELVVQAYPAKYLGGIGNETGTFWSGEAVFSSDRIGDVIDALVPLVNDRDAPAAGIFIVTNDPDLGIILVIDVSYYGSSIDAETFFKALSFLKPIAWTTGRTPYLNINDGNSPYNVKGGFKDFLLSGLPRLENDRNGWQGVLETYTLLLKEAPDATSTAYAFEWSGGKLVNHNTPPDTAWSHRNVGVWMEALSWYTQPESRTNVGRSENRVISLLTRKFHASEIQHYQNFDRSSPIETRYGGHERLSRLKALKKKYDPEGAFTKVFL